MPRLDPWIQLKASQEGGKTADQAIAQHLADKRGACVVWLVFDPDPTNHRASLSYLWFDGEPNEPMPHLGDKVATTNKQRPGYRRLTIGRFTKVARGKPLAEHPVHRNARRG